MKKIITLTNIDLVDFFGVQNKNLKLLISFFPSLEIVASENITVSGPKQSVDLFNEKIQNIIDLYKQNKLNYEVLKSTLSGEDKEEINNEVILRSNSNIIKPKSVKQKMMVDLSSKNDLLFVFGPAGTGKTYVAVCLAVKALRTKRLKELF